LNCCCGCVTHGKLFGEYGVDGYELSRLDRGCQNR
jgi:hypothetical protein